MTNDMENNNWLDDTPSLKLVSKTNPFTVPVGYFDGLNERILSGIKLDEIKNTTPSDGFTVPENYFEDMAAAIKSRITIETILTPEDTGFAVPANYFDQLSNTIQSRLLVEQAMANAEDTFKVPEGYFNRLNKDILNKTIKQDDVVVKRNGAVIRMLTSTAFKYATAACLILTLGTDIFFRLESPTAVHDRSFLHQELSTIPVNDIQNYLEDNVDANDAQHTVSDENLPVNAADLKAALQNYTDGDQ